MATTIDHHYISTACLHDRHDDCRHTCKYCGNACQCRTCGHPVVRNTDECTASEPCQDPEWCAGGGLCIKATGGRRITTTANATEALRATASKQRTWQPDPTYAPGKSDQWAYEHARANRTKPEWEQADVPDLNYGDMRLRLLVYDLIEQIIDLTPTSRAAWEKVVHLRKQCRGMLP